MQADQSEFAGIARWALAWESRAKLIAAIVFIFGVISLQTTPIALLAYGISLVTTMAIGISLITLLKRYLLIAPFVLLMTIPLVIGGGFPIDPDRVEFASLIILKAITSMTVITIILETQTVEQFMTSLADLKVPPVMITVLLLSYRYVYLFLDDIQKMQLALKTRFFNGGISIKKLKVYGQLTGCLLIKSLDRSEKVFQAMQARGFNGILRFEKSRNLDKFDFLKSTLVLISMILLLFIEQTYMK
ncbi:cobalt ECF transporter T component CbiQ [Desertibacillus haloalkaliphilus]|uniref:cobalt ECF transporter T component CbiQ n=1 Tax=Desertibacillus haloalkaliphilus TaxID=1328930 RepID=UPI001C271590|nr:cobalt ECF transporter T component CbiQ [Desertibacillus haloalkaliphilus]MBU8906362.1 cobalt ECF transporter T component CbiQ [Desertibacillus haloalkaliphilus]